MPEESEVSMRQMRRKFTAFSYGFTKMLIEELDILLANGELWCDEFGNRQAPPHKHCVWRLDSYAFVVIFHLAEQMRFGFIVEDATPISLEDFAVRQSVCLLDIERLIATARRFLETCEKFVQRFPNLDLPDKKHLLRLARKQFQLPQPKA